MPRALHRDTLHDPLRQAADVNSRVLVLHAALSRNAGVASIAPRYDEARACGHAGRERVRPKERTAAMRETETLAECADIEQRCRERAEDD